MICLGNTADQSLRGERSFIEFSLHRDAYQRKEVWFTDNMSGITGVLLSQGLVDRVTPIGSKTLGNKHFVLGPLTFKLRTFLAKQVSQDFMYPFLGLIAPHQEPLVPAQGCTPLQHCFRPESGGRSKAAKRLGDFLQIE